METKNRKNKLKGCFMHESDHWKTPKKMYDWYTKECEYFDPCPYKCESFDGLEIKWPKNVFVNPPYSQIEKWVDKAIEEHKRQPNSDIVLLVPARTDTKWFAKIMKHASQVKFLTGRLHFNDDKNPAPFPSILINLYYSTESTECYCVKRDHYVYEI